AMARRKASGRASPKPPRMTCPALTTIRAHSYHAMMRTTLPTQGSSATVILLLASSGPPRPDERPLVAPRPAVAQAAGETGVAPVPAPADVSTPDRALSVDEARRLMVELINRDRRSMGLAPVELDLGAPSRAAQVHADDMASRGYLGHWGS